MFEIREIKNKAEYNPSFISKNVPFTQAWFFGEWQETAGRKVRRFEIKDNSVLISSFQIIKYNLPLSLSFLYIPHGPILLQDYEGRVDFLDFLKKQFNKIAKEEGAAFLRFDFWPTYKSDLKKYFQETPASQYHSSYFQPKHEWILDLEKSEEELLSGMHQKTRYNINLAANKGVKVEISEGLASHFADFYKLLKETAERNKFGLHQESYYRNVFKSCEQNGNAFLAIARHDKTILAANLMLFYGETAYFLYGGSSDEFKKLMAPHLAHWKGILEAKRRNCKIYNFGAVDGSGFEGISRFKKGFGGSLLEYSDSYDLVLKPLWYYLYRFVKSIH